MAELIGDVTVVVVALVLMDVVLLIGFVAAVVVRMLITSGRLLSVAIVTIPAMHIATNITNHTRIL